jgi:hypothetical protein
VKILAENAGLASVGIESDQIVFRYPAQQEKLTLKELFIAGNHVRSGRNSYWFAYKKFGENWQAMVIQILNELCELTPTLS